MNQRHLGRGRTAPREGDELAGMEAARMELKAVESGGGLRREGGKEEETLGDKREPSAYLDF